MSYSTPTVIDEALLINVLVPRPLFWLTTSNADAGINMAPFSAITIVSNSPPTLLLAIERCLDGSPKRSSKNIVERRDFVVNTPAKEQLYDLMLSADPAIAREQRAGIAKVRMAPAHQVDSQLILDCNSALECRLQRHEVLEGSPGSDIFWAEILAVHLPSSKVLPRAFLGALGYEWFVSQDGLHHVRQPYVESIREQSWSSSIRISSIGENE